MLWIGIAGFVLLAAFLFCGLWIDHVRERPVYERPRILVRPGFWIAFRALRFAFFLAGWAMSARVFPRSAGVLAALLALGWGWKRLVRGRHFRRRMVRRAFTLEKRRDPAASDVQILQRVLHAIHPHWGEELLEQIALDNPTPERTADMICRIEQGALPAGFSPARLLRLR
jgi:hypothetical protein